MKVNKLYGIDGAKIATGTVIIVDVFRAATVEAYLLNENVKYIIPVSTANEAFAQKKDHPEYLLFGEEWGTKIDGFDMGNSPSEIVNKKLTNKIIVHRSSQGTQGILNATKAKQIIFGSFTCVSAIVSYLKKNKPQEISIVSMDGENSDDDIYADYLISRLKSTKNIDFDLIKDRLKKHARTAKFLDENFPEFPKNDFYLCLDLDRFNFFPVVIKSNSEIHIVKSDLLKK